MSRKKINHFFAWKIEPQPSADRKELVLDSINQGPPNHPPRAKDGVMHSSW